MFYVFIYLRQRRRYMFLPVFVCLSRPHFIILASCKPGFRPGLQPFFSTTSCGFATCFRHTFDFFAENLVANLLHQSRHVEIDAACSLVLARARQMECRKKTVSSQGTNLLKLDFRYVFYYSCLL